MEIVKVCKKHGELTKDKTFEHKKKGCVYRYCNLCKLEVRRKYDAINKIENNKIRKEKNSKLLSEGLIKKICGIHNEVSFEDTRVNSRGHLVCKKCERSNAKKSRYKDIKNHRKKCREWSARNPEKMKQYALNYKSRRREIAKALHKKWMSDPIQREKILNWQRKSGKKAIKDLSDAYIKGLIKTYRTGGKNNRFYQYMKIEVSPEIIQLKRLQVKLNREIRKKRKVKDVDQ